MPAPPLACYVIRGPPFLEYHGFKPARQYLVTNRYHRDKNHYFVDWRQQEFPTCPTLNRGIHYVRVPHWWEGVEVPFGAITELPSVHCYFGDLLGAKDTYTWNVLRSEWSVNTGVRLLDEARRTSKLWLYPRALRTWIRRVSVETICQGRSGVDSLAVRDLESLLDLLDTVAPIPGLMAHLKRADPKSKLRTSWIQVRFEATDGVWGARVDEDLFPLDLPYSSNVLESRGLLGDQGFEGTWFQGTVPPGPEEPPARGSTGSIGRRQGPTSTLTIRVANLLV